MALFKAAAAQLLACIVTALALKGGLLPLEPLWRTAAVQAVLACSAAAALRSEPWWLPIHLAFMPALLLASGLHLAPAWYLAAFMACALVFWSSYRTRVPLYLSNRATARAVAKLLGDRPPGRLLDLGSGTGSLLRPLATLCPAWRLAGIEAAPLPYWWSAWRASGCHNLDVRRGDFFDADWSGYDVVYAFLSPVPMAQVWDKACAEMPEGSLLVSNSFAIPGAPASGMIELEDRRRTRLYLYRPRSGKARKGR